MLSRLKNFFQDKSSIWRSVVLFFLLFPSLLTAVTALTLAIWVVPNIDRYHQFIEVEAARAIEAPVKIEKIKADWSGINPRLRFENIRIFDQQGRATLTLDQVENVLSWRTLFVGELRLKSLLIEQPSLSIQRDAQGVLSVAGIKIDENKNSGGADWLLRQGQITINNARLSWLDATRNSAILPFEKVNFSLENHGRHHLVSITATPPAFLASPIEVHGKLIGRHFSDLPKWQGEVDARLDNFDALALQYWLPIPLQLKQATGSVHAWLKIDQNGLRQVTADLAVRDVENRFAETLPNCQFKRLNGRLTWQESARGFQVSANNLSFTLADGFVLPATDFSFQQQVAKAKKSAETVLQISAIDFARSQPLLNYLPIDVAFKQQVIQANPQGRLSNLKLSWWGRPQDLQHYQIHAQFDGLAMRAVGDRPGFSGLSGMLDASENKGSLLLKSSGLTLNAPHYLLEPLAFERLDLDAAWQQQKSVWKFQINQLRLSNADLAGTASGSYETNGKDLGSADANIQLTRASVPHVARYIPLHTLGDETQAWLQSGLLAGEASQFSLKLRGDLNHFPFPENRLGLFQITAKTHDVALEYQTNWPHIEKANADLLIEGRRLVVTADKAKIGTGEVQNVSVTLPDMLSDRLSLIVRGESSGATQHALNYINNSPLRVALKNFTQEIKSLGDGKLNLLLNIPLSGNDDIKVQGSYRFNDNEIDLGEFIPTLTKVSGELNFTEATLNSRNIAAQVLGGPAKISVRTEQNGRLNVAAEGRINAENLPPLPPAGVLKHLYGSTNWTTNVSALGDDLNVSVDSNLVGLGADLPSPFAKNRHENVPIRFEMKNLSATKDQFSLRYGKAIKAILIRQVDKQGNWSVKRGTINFGNVASTQTEHDGVWITGTLPYFSLHDWLATGIAAGAGTSHSLLSDLAGIDLTVNKFTAFNSEFNELKITGLTSGNLFKTHLNAAELKGELQWQAQGPGRLQLRLKEAALGNASKPVATSPTQGAPSIESSVPAVRKINLPTIDVAIDQFYYQHKTLGKLEFHLSQQGQDILLDHMRLANPDGTLVANGKWDLNSAQTHVNFKLDIAEAGKILDRSGYPGTLKDTKGSLSCDLLWSGGPDEFDQSNLSGSLDLKVGKGQFLKINPGAGKLLSVLNLQALPKRVTLDFTDVFSEGFEFDRIEATAQINQGVLVTKDLKIDGSAATVQMAGQVDLKRETQNLRVRISPKLSNTVSLIAFAGGPVVGAGVLLASKVLSDPLDKMSSFEYNITGNWADPIVNKLSVESGRP